MTLCSHLLQSYSAFFFGRHPRESVVRPVRGLPPSATGLCVLPKSPSFFLPRVCFLLRVRLMCGFPRVDVRVDVRLHVSFHVRLHVRVDVRHDVRCAGAGFVLDRRRVPGCVWMTVLQEVL